MHPIRPTSRTRTAGERAAGLLLCVGLAVPALAACGGEPIAVQDVPSTTRQSGSAPAPLDVPTPAPTGSAPAYWSFPADVEGWELTVQDEDGLNQLTKDRSCNYVSSQNLFSPSGNGDRADSEDLARQWEDSLSSRYTDVRSTTSDSQDIRSRPSGEAVEMVRVESTYTHKGVGIRATTWVRTFTTIGTPTAVILTYTCEAGSYSTTELDQLLGDTAVVNPGPAKMDDGRSSGTSPDQT